MDQSEKTKARGVINSLSSFINEFEASKTAPNVVFISNEQLQLIKKFFPYYLRDEHFVYEKRELKIVISNSDVVGVAYSYFTDYYLDYASNEIS